MRIDRMLAIVVLLLNRKKVTAKDLADRFEISLRTVYRDIDAINEAGIPIVSHQGSGGGFSIMDNYRLNHQYLSLDNMRAILTALKGVSTTMKNPEVELTMEKIRSLIPEDQTAVMERRLDQFVVDYMPWGFNSLMQERIQQINQAIEDGRLVEMHYLNLKGESFARVVEPMTLMFKGYNWYLFGFCRSREDGRIFRLSRIQELKSLKQSFTRRDLHFEDFTKSDDQKQQTIDLELKFDPLAGLRVREFFYAEQISVDEDGSLVVKANFPEDQWIYSLILSYGTFVEVMKPPHLRKKIQDIAKKIQSIYQT